MIGNRSLLIVFLFYWFYLLLGAVVFHYLETPKETETTRTLNRLSGQFLKNSSCVDQEQFKKLVATIIAAYDEGIIYGNNQSATNWNFGSSYFFAVTVATTIGYGHITPITAGGRAFCFFFAIFGIPLSAVLLAGLGERLLRLINKVKDAACMPTNEHLKKGVVGIILVGCGFLVFMLIPSAIFMSQENWNMGESLYFAFVSLTTIGFGDYVIGVDADSWSKEWYRGLMSVWIVLGLAWMASILTYIGDVVQEQVKEVDDKLESIQLGKRGSAKEKQEADNGESNTVQESARTEQGVSNEGFVYVS